MDFKIDTSNIHESFERIASALINHYELQVNGTAVWLCDLEFYWNDGAEHKDESTHSIF